MKTSRVKSIRAVLMMAVLGVASSALAQAPRVFVSAQRGDDANACTVASPCRNFSRAIIVVANGGEIIPLDSGGYGPVAIAKPVTISTPEGVYAGISVTSPGGFGISIATDGLDVKLRGITINGLGGSTGVDVHAANVRLSMERMNIRNFPVAAIDFVSAGGLLSLSDSILRDGSAVGLRVSSPDSGSFARASIDHVRANNFGGQFTGAFSAEGNSEVTVRDSVASGNFRGFQVMGDNGVARMTVENCAAIENVVGLFGTTTNGGPSATMRVSHSVISHNTLFAIEAQTGSQVTSRGDNTVIDNNTAENFSDTFLPK